MRAVALLTAALTSSIASGYSAGYTFGCPNGGGVNADGLPGHGSEAAPHATLSVTTAAGVAVTSYVPGTAYRIVINSATTPFKGFVAGVFPGATAPAGFTGTMLGSVTSTGSDSQVMASPCAGGATHTSSALKTSATLGWTAPVSASGTATVYALVVTSNDEWARVSLSLPKAAPSPSKTAAATKSKTRPAVTPTRTRTRTRTPTRTRSRTASKSKTPKKLL